VVAGVVAAGAVDESSPRRAIAATVATTAMARHVTEAIRDIGHRGYEPGPAG
jgi:hypothetical protein